MKNLNNPLSPHLQVYKPQITSVLSILHRLTGVYLSLSIFFISYWLFSIFLGQDFYYSSLSFLKSSILKFLYIFWFFCFSYHLFNGVRHLLWDFGYGFSHKEITTSGLVVIFLSVISTISLTFILI